MSFEDQVDLCRKILYWHNSLDTEEEPVRMVQDVRKKCGLALGKETTKNVRNYLFSSMHHELNIFLKMVLEYIKTL